jgi:hypothetical protein
VVSDEIITAAAGLLGVVVGGSLGFTFEWLRARSERRRAVGATAVRCLARLEKIREALDAEAKSLEWAAPRAGRRLWRIASEPAAKDPIEDAKRIVLDEKHLLGGDLDHYLAAIASLGRSSEHNRHWKLHEMMVPIVIRADFGTLNEAIDGLTEVRQELEQSRSWFRR